MQYQLMKLFRSLSVMLVLTSPVFAQIPVRTSLGIGSSFLTLNTVDAVGEQRLTGFGFGGKATIAYKRLGLGLQYLEGSLNPSGTGTDKELVEGEMMLSVRASSWLRLALGPHIRSLVIPEGTERWLFWEGRVQTKANLGTPRLESVLELWHVVSASVEVDDAYDRGQGVMGSLRWELSSLPVWIGLGYRIDRSNLANGARTEVMEHFTISVGLGRGAL
jgi:hypothetical protein